MMIRSGRRNRWWVSGFVLLGLAICFFLPFGAIGALDAAFTKSVVVPHQRTSTQQPADQPVDRASQRDKAHASPPVQTVRSRPVAPVLRRLASTLTPTFVGVVAVLVVLYAIANRGARAPANLPLLARPPSRGPPSSC